MIIILDALAKTILLKPSNMSAARDSNKTVLSWTQDYKLVDIDHFEVHVGMDPSKLTRKSLLTYL